MVAAKSNIGAWNYVLSGKIDRAIEINLDSLRMAEDSGDIYAKGVAYGSHGVSCYCKGIFDEAQESLQKGLVFCEKMKQSSWWSMASWWLGHLYTDLEDYERAQQYYEKGNSISDEYSLLPSWKSLALLSLARAKVLSHDRHINLNDQFERCRNIKVKSLEGWKARIVAEILLNIDAEHISEAEEWIRKAIGADKRNGMMFHLGSDYALYAELLKRKNDISKAKKNLAKAIEILKECGADGWVEKHEKELAKL
jgi:tetratricopeptide (TPR) repeat protein